MEFRYLLGILKAHARFLVLTSGVACLSGLAATYVLSEKYAATTKILIRPREEVNLAPTHKAMMDFPVSINIPAEAMSETYAAVMTSEAVATRVVDRLKLHALVPEPDRRWYVRVYHTLRDWAKIGVKYTWDFVRYGRVEHKDPYWNAVDEVLDGLEAVPMGNTYLFELTATWDDPKFAALIADTAAQVFVDYNLETSRTEDGTSAEFIGRRAEELRRSLDEARARLEEFRAQTGASNWDYQLALKLDQLSGFESAYQQTLKELREVEAEVAVVETQLASQSAEKRSSSVLTKNPVVLRLAEDLAGYEVELAGLEESVTPSHPRMKALLARIEEARDRIAREEPQVPYQESSSINAIHEQLTAKLLDRFATRDLLRSRREALAESAALYREDVARLTEQKKQLDDLTLEASVTESEYRLVRQEQGEARMALAQEISEIRILHSAVPPLYPEGPIKLYYAGGALLLGFLGALTLLLLADYTYPRVVTANEAEALLGAPVIAAMPRGGLPPGADLLLGRIAPPPAATLRRIAENANESNGREEAE